MHARLASASRLFPAARLCCLAFFLAALTCVCAADPPPAPPNIVIILADDYGWGSAGCYGAQGVATPSLDRLAQEGRRFTHAYAPGSVCSPTRYGLMTGRYYWRTPVKDGKVLAGNSPLHIETDRLTLASLCKRRGYQTAAFGKWHLGMTTDRVTDWSVPLKPGPLEIGFDHFYGMAANIGNGPHSFIEDHGVTGHIPGMPVVVQRGSPASNTTTGILAPWKSDCVMDTLTSKVCEWIRSHQERPFFVYFAPNAVHEPIVPNSRFAGSRLGKYGDFIRDLDWSVGQILGTLDGSGLSQYTLVIFTSDNGGVVNPGNQSASAAIRAGLAINGPLRGGKHSEWEGGFREPFIIRWPGKVPAGTVSDQVICLTDILATLARVLDVPLPKGNAEDSFDVLRAFTEAAPGPPVRDHVILQSADATYAIRSGDWKLVERADVPEFTSVRNPRKAAQAARKRRNAPQDDQLFNLRDDPSETSDVAQLHGNRAADMRQVLDAARRRGFTRPGAQADDSRTTTGLNVLLIISDDLRDTVHCYGNASVKTPNLDRLAARGLRFDRAYAQYPVCNPSRTSFLTGLRCEQTGVVQNNTMFRTMLPDVVTLPQLLRQNGWHTASYGKVFHAGEAKGEIRDGWIDRGRSWDEADMFRATPAGDVVEGRNLTGGKLRWCEWGAAAGDDDDQPDGQTARHSIAVIERYTSESRPWMVAAGFHRPHDPFISPKKYFDLYPPGSLPMYHDPADISPLEPLSIAGMEFQKAFDAFSDQDRAEFLHAYYAGVSFMDAQVGRLLDTLDRLRLWDSTLVIFIGDNGYHHNERRWWNKATLFERSCRVPFIAAAPGIKGGQVCRSLVELVDLYPTVVDYCGLAAPHTLAGQSLRPLVEHPTTPGRDAAFTLVARGGGRYGQAVRTDRWRYIQWSDGNAELYDELNDPQETHNLARANDHAEQVLEMKELLNRIGPLQSRQPVAPRGRDDNMETTSGVKQ